MDRYESIVMAEALDYIRIEMDLGYVKPTDDLDDTIESINGVVHDDLTVSTHDTFGYLFSHHLDDEVDWTLPIEEVVWYADGVIREHIVKDNAGTIRRALDEH